MTEKYPEGKHTLNDGIKPEDKKFVDGVSFTRNAHTCSFPVKFSETLFTSCFFLSHKYLTLINSHSIKGNFTPYCLFYAEFNLSKISAEFVIVIVRQRNKNKR